MGGAWSANWELRNAYTVLVGNLKRRDRSEDLGIDGKLILKWIFRSLCSGIIWLGIRTGGVSCEHGNEHFIPIKDGQFIEQLSDCQLLMKELVAVSKTDAGRMMQGVPSAACLVRQSPSVANSRSSSQLLPPPFTEPEG
jgi:hypothetical protein